MTHFRAWNPWKISEYEAEILDLLCQQNIEIKQIQRILNIPHTKVQDRIRSARYRMAGVPPSKGKLANIKPFTLIRTCVEWSVWRKRNP